MSIVSVAYSEWGSQNRVSLHETLRCISAAGASVGRVVIVDNKLDCAPYQGEYANCVSVIAGANSAREFSGWDIGVDSIKQDVGMDVLICANDTFAAHRRVRAVRRSRIARWIQIVGASATPEMFGQVDKFEEDAIACPFGTLTTYISSYLFGMNAAASRLVFPLAAIEPDANSMLHDRFSPAGLFTGVVPQAYRSRIEHWLFTPGQWRNAAPLSAENYEFFRLKAKSIIYEHALTSRARADGILVSDIYTGRGSTDKIVACMGKAWMTSSSALNQWVRKVVKPFGSPAPVTRSKSGQMG